jgi:signal transduction histidine kinase
VFRQFPPGSLGPSAGGTTVVGRAGGSDVHTLMVDFNQMADRVGALIHVQKTVVRDLSHELRSPLTRLRLALQIEHEETRPSPILDRMDVERYSKRILAIMPLSSWLNRWQ